MTIRPFDSPDGRRPFLERLAQAPGIDVEDDWGTRYPNILLSTLFSDEALTGFLEVDWSVARVKESNPG